MKSRMFAVFSLGALAATISLGAVSYANAAGDAVLKACANKSTGTMRYLTKGSCKKTEIALSWGKAGPPGLQGPIGMTGSPGGSATVRAFDATGKDLGVVLSADTSVVTVLYQDGVWKWSRTAYSSRDVLNSYRDSSCTIPIFIDEPVLFYSNIQNVWPSSARFVLQRSYDTTPNKAFRLRGNPIRLNLIQPSYQWDESQQQCGAISWEGPIPDNVLFYDLEQVELPAYTPPISLAVR